MLESVLFMVAKFVLKACLRSAGGAALKEAAKAEVYKLIPGEKFDPIVWSVVESLFDEIVGEATKRIGDQANVDTDKLAQEVVDSLTPKALASLNSLDTSHIV